MKAEKNLTCPQCGRRYAEPSDRCSVDGSPLYGPEVLKRLGQRLNNYKIHSLLGEGGMGVVYKGEHAMLGKPVAIKVLHERFARREGAMDQFLREAQAASRIRHPNIVDVTDFGETPDGCIYFVMEYLEGESLEDVLARDHHLELFNAVNVVRQVAHALAACHDQGIVHLDLKPENIYLINREGRRKIVRRVDEADSGFVVEKEGNFDFVKLLDFGVAKFTQDNLGPGMGTRAGMVFGTPHYMSPEQARGEKVDGRSDVYSLGILFYEMIIGEVPFEGDVALDILNAHVSTPPEPPQDRDAAVDEGTNRTILKAIEKDARDRYQSMDELVAALVDCFTDRVFLRDVHRLPGAIESGIVPPSMPMRQPGAPIMPTPPEPMAPAPQPRTRRQTSLTEELQELFGAEHPGVDGAEEPEIVSRSQTPLPLAAVKRPSGHFGDEDYAPASPGAPGLPGSAPSRDQRVTGTYTEGAFAGSPGGATNGPGAAEDDDVPTGEFEKDEVVTQKVLDDGEGQPRQRRSTAPLASRGKK
jgi:serine/threonine protein kinase